MQGVAKIAFALIGVGFSVFYARKAVEIFVDTTKLGEKERLASWRFHQLWLNFVGSLTGWAAAYY